MTDIKFSIIIPVYKVEKYLDRCVTSAINQSYKNIEIILVDDGSPDNCPAMCDAYAKIDERILVIHKINGGLSDARNEGIKASTGEYIIFLDSDDSIEITACEEIYRAIEQANFPEVIVCNTKKIENGNETIMNRYSRLELFDSGKSFLKYLFSMTFDFCMLSPNNIYKRNLLIEKKLYFEKGILHEDERWTPIVFLNANTVLNTNIQHYNYYIRDNSITTSKNKTKNAIDLIQTVYYLKEQYEKISDSFLRNSLLDHISGLYLHAIYIGDLSKDKRYINRTLCLNLSKKVKKKIKSLVFFVSPRLYCFLMRIK